MLAKTETFSDEILAHSRTQREWYRVAERRGFCLQTRRTQLSRMLTNSRINVLVLWHDTAQASVQRA